MTYQRILIARHTRKQAKKAMSMHSVNWLSYFHDRPTYSCFFAGDAFPAGSSPFLSGYPGPSPLTSDPSYRSANTSSLHMAQLWASHAHDGKPPSSSANAFISPSLSVSVHVLYPQRHRRHYIFICHSELLSKAQEACSFPFHCFHQWHPVPFLSPCCWLCSWLCPICISFSLSSTCLLLTPVIDYCNLSSVTCSFLSFLSNMYFVFGYLYSPTCPLTSLPDLSSRNIYVCVLSSASLSFGLFTE